MKKNHLHIHHTQFRSNER